MDKEKFWLTIGIGVLFIVSVEFGQYLSSTTAVINDPDKQELDWQKEKYRKGLIVECQKMAATTTNPNWKYTNCLEDLGLKPKELRVD